MSLERELLNRSRYNLDREYCADLIDEIQELLAQPEQKPEQEPVGYLYKQIDCTGEWATIFKLDKPYITWHEIKDIVPLYTAPPKREPIEDGELEVWYSHIYQQPRHNTHLTWAMDKQEYIWGFRDAEKCYGITGGGE